MNISEKFTRSARLDLTLGDLLDEARAIRAARWSFGSPGVSGRWNPNRVYRESYVWTFSAPGDEIERLRAAATLLAPFPRATCSVPYQEVPHEKPVLPARAHNPECHRMPVPQEMVAPDHYANIAAARAEQPKAEAGEAAANAGT